MAVVSQRLFWLFVMLVAFCIEVAFAAGERRKVFAGGRFRAGRTPEPGTFSGQSERSQENGEQPVQVVIVRSKFIPEFEDRDVRVRFVRTVFAIIGVMWTAMPYNILRCNVQSDRIAVMEAERQRYVERRNVTFSGTPVEYGFCQCDSCESDIRLYSDCDACGDGHAQTNIPSFLM
ncbi:hypothetical protein Tcan_10583 [Toxocara canis]|uniref:Uncharacterized protein n=1 Tax=Toxocara canis TaxID=6265 RepID=A0A0B2UPP8_TOXCA|nr:hypothetical protein Tcan_10583 [Toxocara canis]